VPAITAAVARTGTLKQQTTATNNGNRNFREIVFIKQVQLTI